MYMEWILCLIVIVCILALIALWFCQTRRRLREQFDMVLSARRQLEDYEKKAASAVSDADVTEVLRRSRSIYRQAAENYNTALHHPLLSLPGKLMGFVEEPLG